MSTVKTYGEQTVTITRLTGSGPRRTGQVYRASGEGKTLTGSFHGRRGGMDAWGVNGQILFGDLGFLTLQYGEDDDS